MTARIVWTVVPILLLLAGTASIVVGVKLHAMPVLAQIENKQAAPKDLPAGSRPLWMQQGPAGPQAPSYIATLLKETEPQLIREVTVGGVTLADGGQIKRTYSGDTPSLCPT